MNKLKDFSQQETHNDLIASWNEAEELNTSLRELSDTDLIECRQALIKRSESILHWLGKYVSEDDVIS